MTDPVYKRIVRYYVIKGSNQQVIAEHPLLRVPRVGEVVMFDHVDDYVAAYTSGSKTSVDFIVASIRSSIRRAGGTVLEVINVFVHYLG